jgi:integrase
LEQETEKIGKTKTRLERFLEYQTAQSTKTTYRGGLKKFFAFLYPNLLLEEAAEQYFDGRSEENFEDDVKGFSVSIRKTGLAPTSMRTHMASVRAFLEDNRIILTSAFWRKTGKKLEGRKVTEDQQPTDEELVRIFEHLPLRGRALFHLLATSGIRIGSALRLTTNDIKLNADHVQITVRAPGEKKRAGFIAFASEQTKELLDEWLNYGREGYLASAINRTERFRREKDTDDDRVFPMHQATANNLWRKALEDTGLDERDPNTGWTIRHSHTLRARVRSRMAIAGVSPDIAYALIGQRTYMDQYKDWTTAEKLVPYKTAEPFLIFSGTATTVKELDEKMERQNKELQEILTQELTRLSIENKGLKKQVNALFALVGGETKMTGQERFDSEMTDEAKAEFKKLKEKVLR